MNSKMNKLVLALLITSALVGCAAKDSTDPAEGISGLSLFSDNMTGCQYLSHNSGALTPRMNADGKQVCTKGAQ